MKRKILKAILLILIVLIVVFTIVTMRNLEIIENMIIAHNELAESTNYHMKKIYDNGDYIEVYYKEGEYLYTYSDNTVYTFYVTNDEKLLIIESEDSKTYSNLVNEPTLFGLPTSVFYERDTFWEKLKMTIFTWIRTEEYNGEQVYYLAQPYMKTWIDKDTYITVKTDEGGLEIIDYEIELGTVTDSDLVKPDLSEYTLQDSSDNSSTFNTGETEEVEDEYYFYATVIEVDTNSIMVEPDESENISDDKISINVDNSDLYQEGTRVKVTFDGIIMTSYPAQVSASNIEIVSE